MLFELSIRLYEAYKIKSEVIRVINLFAVDTYSFYIKNVSIDILHGCTFTQLYKLGTIFILRLGRMVWILIEIEIFFLLY